MRGVTVDTRPALHGVPLWTRHTIAIGQVWALLLGAQARGLTLAPLLRRAGISDALLASPQARVTSSQYLSLSRIVRRATRDEFWGLLTKPLPLGSFGDCCRLLVSEYRLEGALRTGLAFFRRNITEFTPRLRVNKGMALVELVDTLGEPGGERGLFAQRAFLFLTLGLASWLVARQIPLLRVNYRSPHPSHMTDAQRLFQAPLHFGQPRAGFAFDARWLDLPVVQNRHSLQAFLQDAPANLLIRYRDHTSTTERIRRLLRGRLHGALPSLEEVGREIGMAPFTLRRRLHEEGQSFRGLKEDLRRDTAIEVLERSDLPIAELAPLLGFTEASTFHRAFKGWTGVTPGEYRMRHGTLRGRNGA